MVKLSQMQQGTLYLRIGGRMSIFLRYYYNIPSPTEDIFMQSVAFSHQSCDSVAHNTVTDFLTDRYSHSVPICMVFQYIHHQMFIGI